MSDSVAAAKTTHVVEVHHEELGFWRTYIFSTDHKMIGKQYLFLGLAWLVLGGLMALMVRWQLAWPETAVPGFGWVPEPYMFEGVMGPEFYNMLVTMHGTIMVFFVVMPILIGCFGNFLIPLMIGARDMAFPFLNMLSFWVLFLASLVMLASFVVPGGAAASGWTAYAPLSAKAVYTGVAWGQDLWILGIALMIVSSTMGGINFITTIINMRAPGLTFFRLPFFIWFLFITALLFLFSAPVLTAAAFMLLSDRQLRTSFFLPEGGGEPLLWQHLFWFFGHPEVYVLVLPAIGAVAEILPVFARKPSFSYRYSVYSLLAAALLSFIVWGHHMFISGMDPRLLATAFTVLTITISAPFSLIVFNLVATLWGGSIRLRAPMLYALGSLAMFIIGGLSGIFNGSMAIDIYIHDTYFVVGHFHYIIFGAILFGGFAAITYWFPKMFGRMMNETLGKIHFWLTFLFTNLTFFPMHLIGMGGHMRRIYNPLQYEFLQPLQPMNVFITASAIVLGLSQMLFLINFFWSLFAGKRAEQNPWQANTLEWSAPTPPPHGNWGDAIPVVYRGPYEYSPPEVTDDYLPQDQPLVPETTAAAH
jgi:cytochrome c oxidase subunit 1